MLSAELSVSLDAIEKAAGTRWLHDQVHRIRGADPRYEIGAAPGGAGVHPLALSWYNAREELILSEITGTGSFSEATLRVAGLGKNLSSASGLAGFMEQKNRLLDQSLFRNAAYEIAIAAGYARLGETVEFTAPGLKIGLPGGCVIVDCFAADGNGEDVLSGFYGIIKEKLKKGEGCDSPSMIYIEIPAESSSRLRQNVKQHVENSKDWLAGKAWNALVLTCQGKATGPEGITLREEAFAFVNPSPRFCLPAGFKIYVPGESSSIS